MEAVNEYLSRILSNRHLIRTAMVKENRAQYIFFTAPSNPLVDIYRNHFRESVEQATWESTVCHQAFPR